MVRLLPAAPVNVNTIWLNSRVFEYPLTRISIDVAVRVPNFNELITGTLAAIVDVFVGAEALIGEGLAAGAAGAVSGLASAFPEIVVEAVRSGDSTAAGELRAIVDRFPRHAALKAVVASS